MKTQRLKIATFSTLSGIGFLLALLGAMSTQAQNWSTTNGDIYNTNAGKVGIGSMNPTGILEVKGYTFHTLVDEFGNTSCSGNTVLKINGLENFSGGLSPNSPGCSISQGNLLEVRVTNTAGINTLKTVINAQGRWGIGDNILPTQKLDIDGQIRMRTGAQNNYVVAGDQNGVMRWADITTLLPPAMGLWELHPTSSSQGKTAIIGKNLGEVHIGNRSHAMVLDPVVKANYRYINKVDDVALFFGPTTDEGDGQTPGFTIAPRNLNEPWAGMRMDWEGNVCIGCNDTKGYQLAVKGEMIAELVRVKLNTNWPDYVFQENYPLMPLSEVETYIQTEGHLPGIPDAATIQKEGIDLAEMNRLLLEKVEELTLYVIELEKQLKP